MKRLSMDSKSDRSSEGHLISAPSLFCFVLCFLVKTYLVAQKSGIEIVSNNYNLYLKNKLYLIFFK